MDLDGELLGLFHAHETLNTIATDCPPCSAVPGDAEHDRNSFWTFELAVREAEALLGHRDGNDTKTVETGPLAGW